MFLRQKADNGVEYFVSTVLGTPHAFATRLGGVSTLPETASLNLARGRGDDDAVVRENLSRFAAAVGFDEHRLVSLPQVHGTNILEVDDSLLGDGVDFDSGKTADGYLITAPGRFAGIKTADCVPVLLYDPVNRIAAAVHAGWRGTVAGIVYDAVERMIRFGTNPAQIRAAIGPSINGACYEVGEEVLQAAIHTFDAAAYRLCRPEPNKNTYRIDLKEANRLLLVAEGVAPQNIDVCHVCTHCHTDLFYSHRASGGKRGTMMNVIGVV